jgi:hypothetical protein
MISPLWAPIETDIEKAETIIYREASKQQKILAYAKRDQIRISIWFFIWLYSRLFDQ